MGHESLDTLKHYAKLSKLNDRQKKAWEYLQAHECISRREYVRLCDCSASTGLRELQKMSTMGLLSERGRGKTLVYKRLF